MRPIPASVRARAALSAGAVVLVALVVLVAAGLAVLLTLRSSLVREADLQAEAAAREVAAQVAAGTPVAALGLPDADDHPVQVLARLDAGERPRPQPLDLAGLVREVLEQRAPAGRVPVRAVLEPPAGPGPGDGPWVLGSRGRLGQVLGNLLDNAQRHAAGAVTVTLGVRDGRAVLRVADDGPGVPATERERIFERFVRLDDARARDEGGAGLGLAIARDIVRAHGGTLTVRDAPGGGALFEVRLPVGGRP